MFSIRLNIKSSICQLLAELLNMAHRSGNCSEEQMPSKTPETGSAGAGNVSVDGPGAFHRSVLSVSVLARCYCLRSPPLRNIRVCSVLVSKHRGEGTSSHCLEALCAILEGQGPEGHLCWEDCREGGVAPLTSSLCASTSSARRRAGQHAHSLAAGVVAGVLTLPHPPCASGLGRLS